MCSLFLYAYRDSLPTNGFSLRDNRLVLDLKKPDSYLSYDYLDNYVPWQQSHSFCYEVRLPEAQVNQLASRMQYDLRQFFQVSTHVKERLAECLVLKAVEGQDPAGKLKSKGGRQYERYPTKGDTLSFTNASFRALLFGIEMLFGDPNKRTVPFLNDSKIPVDYFIDMKMDGNLFDMAYFRKQLQRYGLDLVRENRLLPMLILKE